MTIFENCKFNMEQLLRDLFNRNPRIINLLPGDFANKLIRFSQNISDIETISEKQQTSRKGIAGKKSILYTNLGIKAYDICTKIEAYAIITGNTVLADEIHFSKSKLTRASASKLRDRSLLIHEKAVANAAALVPYDITAETIAELKSCIDLFVESIPSTRSSRIEAKATTSKLRKLFKENDELLEQFDLLVVVLRNTNPEFYNSYKDSRKIIDTSSGKLMLTAHITDAASGEGIKGVTATFVSESTNPKATSANGEKPLVKKTANKGIFKVKSLPDGIYTVTIEKPGYKTITVTVSISKGEMTMLNASLDKIS